MIPFNQPSIEGDELEYMRLAVEDGHSSAKGPFTERASRLLRSATGAADVLLTTSCTSALEMSAMMLRLQPGDRVIVPSFTFVTTALAFAREGAQLVFADIEDETLGIDPDHVASLIDDRTRAIVPVHYAGIPCQLDALADAVEQSDASPDIIEDNAHGLFGTYRGRPLGSFGRFATLSFHETKNFICGEGGALLVNRREDVDRAHVLLDKGTNRRDFLLGQVDKYSWVDRGSSFGLSDILAGYLLAQLEAKDAILKKRRAVFDAYDERLAPLGEELGFRTPTVPDDATCAYHMYYVLLGDNATRNRVLDSLNRHGFRATFHYVPLHDARAAQEFKAFDTDCPVTTDISGRLLRLPFYNGLDVADIERISEAFLEAVGATPA